MTKFTSNLLFILAMISAINVVAQEESEQEELGKWLHHNYEYLDNDHKITATSAQFDLWKKDFQFKADEPLNYADSLTVVLAQELKNPADQRGARLQLSYSWERASWYLLKDVNEVKELAREKSLAYPFELVSFYRSLDRDHELIEQLADRAKSLDRDEDLEKLNAKELMKHAFRYSPGRLARVDEILASRGQTRGSDDHDDN
ncbi:hypothetical protein [Nonlabens ponticola]|uniref:Uncharacterized protein n=1 Tax=Nonlabens ponticola TaxID=2496866 RepID=A0A3S9MXU4_9FLAO|nr:hypothetical protein [Nonlabens ponticola]AZQ43958.1 hypothetical protein EJ995_06815 [Nonlabens ponticola]